MRISDCGMPNKYYSRFTAKKLAINADATKYWGICDSCGSRETDTPACPAFAEAASRRQA